MNHIRLRRNVWIGMIVLVLVGFAVYQNVLKADRPASAREPAPKLNALAPGFKLTGLDGSLYEVGGKRDKALLINFWASWCGPCELEAPDLKHMYDKYNDRLDLYAVNMTAGDRMDNIQSFVRHFEFNFPVLLDKDGTAGDAYRISGIPMTFLVDKEGVIRDVFGVLHPDELEKRIKRLIEA